MCLIRDRLDESRVRGEVWAGDINWGFISINQEQRGQLAVLVFGIGSQSKARGSSQGYESGGPGKSLDLRKSEDLTVFTYWEKWGIKELKFGWGWRAERMGSETGRNGDVRLSSLMWYCRLDFQRWESPGQRWNIDVLRWAGVGSRWQIMMLTRSNTCLVPTPNAHGQWQDQTDGHCCQGDSSWSGDREFTAQTQRGTWRGLI